MRIEVRYQDHVIGHVAELEGAYYFKYTEQFIKLGIDLSPIHMPISNGAEKIYNFNDIYPKTFYGLPGLLADSIPDKFGNAILNAWLNEQGRSVHTLSSLERLAYIGDRGMGALEYMPDNLSELSHLDKQTLSINELSDMASHILKAKKELKFNVKDSKSLHNLFEIGTSAGGARAKALVSINRKTGEIISGQFKPPQGFDSYLIKFDQLSEQTGRSTEICLIEQIYYEMARKAGIEMMPSKLIEENGRFHFSTKRFDRTPSGEKIHVQTLCGIGHYNFRDFENNSYESLFYIARLLNVTYREREQLFRRMVFNVLARNQDDHTKNFAFLLFKNKWRITPAYDLGFHHDPNGLFTQFHKMSINGKHDNIEYQDLEIIAKQNSIAKPQLIVDEVKQALTNFPKLATKYQLSSGLTEIIKASFRMDIMG